MVVQNTINNLKDRPKEERTAVAGGIAITVVAVLIIGWGIWFFKRIQSGTQQVNLQGGAQDEFNFSSTLEARQNLQDAFSSNEDELRAIRDQAGQDQFQMQTQMQQTQGTQQSQFGTEEGY